MGTIDPRTRLDDVRCAVRSMEVDPLRARCGDGRRVLVDLAAPGFDPTAFGPTLDALSAAIHAARADGGLVRGLEVQRPAHAAAGLGAWPASRGWSPLRPLADLGYRVVARDRRTISTVARPRVDALRRARARAVMQRMRAGEAGRCDIVRRTP
jgi:hypothetical protein